MTDLDRRVEEALSTLPGPDADTTARALRLAFDALPTPRRSRRRGFLVPAGVAIAAAAAGAALAAAGGLDLRRGSSRPSPPAAALAIGELRLPPGLEGLAVLAGERTWSRTRAGFAIEGLGVSAVELSPNGRYLAAGIGESLVALTPAGARVWSHPTTGPVVAAAWAPNPNPIYVAYVVRAAATTELRLIEGDGDHDRLIARGVAAQRPVWRADALRLWFATRDGRPGGYDLAAGRLLPRGDVPPTTLAPVGLRGAHRALARIRRGWVVRAEAGTGAGVVVAKRDRSRSNQTGGRPGQTTNNVADKLLIKPTWRSPGSTPTTPGRQVIRQTTTNRRQS